jgi:hypothetical protein
VKFSKLGFVKGRELRVDDEVLISIAEAKELYENSLAEMLK